MPRPAPVTIATFPSSDGTGVARRVERGIVVEELGGLELVEIEVDEPEAHEVLVRVEATGVCHLDLHVMETGFSHPPPILLGHEGAGVVERVGPGVETIAEGDRVIVGWRARPAAIPMVSARRRAAVPDTSVRRRAVPAPGRPLTRVRRRDVRDADRRARARGRCRSTTCRPSRRA